MKNLSTNILAIMLFLGGTAQVQAAVRDNLSIVGSSTVYPFATVVAERFARSTTFNAPKIEATGSGGGLKLFCQGVGASTPDVTNSSRRIKQSEFDNCQANGVEDIIEVLVGFDGIAIANAKTAPLFNLSLRDIYLALAKDVPGPDGKLIPNPNRTWKDVNPALPAMRIEVLGPPPTSGTRDAFAELAMGGGAASFADLEALEKLEADKADEIRALMQKLGMPSGVYAALAEQRGKAPSGEAVFKTVAYAMREDGAYIEAGENDNLIVQKLEANPDAMGIFGYSFLEENSDKVQGSPINGIAPDFDSIASGEYPISRPLYFYIKGAHIGKIPGVQEYALEFTSENAIGEYGYLTENGLIPLDEEKLDQVREDVKKLNYLKKL